MLDRHELLDALRAAMRAYAATGNGKVTQSVDGANIVVTATWAEKPFLSAAMISPGTHITAVGADEPGKSELDASLILKSYFVCDDEALALEMGALAGAKLGREAIAASLGDVLNGVAPGRRSDEAITVFGSVGLACQDLPAAWMVYQKARQSTARMEFDFHE